MGRPDELRELVTDARSELETLYWRWLSGNKDLTDSLIEVCTSIHAVAAASEPPQLPEPH